jgi:hypothetical protein
VSAAFTVQCTGYLYPARQLTEAELATLIGLVHRLVCTEGLSHRQAQKRLVDFHVRRSTGAIAQYLSRYECDRCATTPAAPAASAPAARPEVLSWQ